MWLRNRFCLGFFGVAIAAFAAVFSTTVAPISAFGQSGCDDLSQNCGDVIAPNCLEKLGAGSLSVEAEASCGDQFEAYRSCLAEVTALCSAPTRASAEPSQEAPSDETAPTAHRLVAETSVTGGRFMFFVTPEPISWADAEQAAVTMGGRLAVVDTSGKHDAMASVLSRRPELFNAQGVLLFQLVWGPWIGGYQRAGAAEPDGGWQWSLDPVSGDTAPIEGDRWFDNQPDNFALTENYLHIFCLARPTCDTWNDAAADAPVQSYIVEILE
ncbi:MAG: hypothetical protein KTR21_14425 [Rhodobacteraceae bacterium]|nr:hypothetical protein [Paracoccaceae bacterium]